jgi:hypothetical protein
MFILIRYKHVIAIPGFVRSRRWTDEIGVFPHFPIKRVDQFIIMQVGIKLWKNAGFVG